MTCSHSHERLPYTFNKYNNKLLYEYTHTQANTTVSMESWNVLGAVKCLLSLKALHILKTYSVLGARQHGDEQKGVSLAPKDRWSIILAL
jgi:hypothetical protein